MIKFIILYLNISIIKNKVNQISNLSQLFNNPSDACNIQTSTCINIRNENIIYHNPNLNITIPIIGNSNFANLSMNTDWSKNCKEYHTGVWRNHDQDPEIIKYLLMNLEESKISSLYNGNSVSCCNDCEQKQINQMIKRKIQDSNTAFTSHCNLMGGNVQSRCQNHIGWIEPHIVCANDKKTTRETINALDTNNRVVSNNELSSSKTNAINTNNYSNINNQSKINSKNENNTTQPSNDKNTKQDPKTKKNIIISLDKPMNDCGCDPCCSGHCTDQPQPFHPDPPSPTPIPPTPKEECDGKSQSSKLNNQGAKEECWCDEHQCQRKCTNCPCGTNCNVENDCQCDKDKKCPECLHGCDQFGNCLCPTFCKNGCLVGGKCREQKEECLNKQCTKCSGEHMEICHQCTTDPILIAESNSRCTSLDPASYCLECTSCTPAACKAPNCKICNGKNCDECLECTKPVDSKCEEYDPTLNCAVCKNCIDCHDPNCLECGGPECKICKKCKKSAMPGFCAEIDLADCSTCLKCKNCVHEKCSKCDPPFCDNCTQCKQPKNEWCSNLKVFSEGQQCKHCEQDKCLKCNGNMPNCKRCSGKNCDECVECIDDGITVRELGLSCAITSCTKCDGNCSTCEIPDCKCDHCETCNNYLCATCEFPGCEKCTKCKNCSSSMCGECSPPNCSDCLKCAKCLGDCDDCEPPNCTCKTVKFTKTILLSEDNVPVD